MCIYIYGYMYIKIYVSISYSSSCDMQICEHPANTKKCTGKNARTTHTQTHIFARADLHIHVRTHTYPHHLCTLKTHYFENVVSIPTRFSARTTSYDAITASCVKPEHPHEEFCRNSIQKRRWDRGPNFLQRICHYSWCFQRVCP